MPIVGDSLRGAVQSGREAAYFWGGTSRRFADRSSWSKVDFVAGRNSKRRDTACHVYYPSPYRSALKKGGPVPVFRSFCEKLAGVIGYQRRFVMQVDTGRPDHGAIRITKLGGKKCKNHQSSSLQWRSLALQAVLKAMWNVALRAQVPGLLRQKFLTQTGPVQSLQALPQVCCVTTQASAPADNKRLHAFTGRSDYLSRRKGCPLRRFSILGA